MRLSKGRRNILTGMEVARESDMNRGKQRGDDGEEIQEVSIVPNIIGTHTGGKLVF